MAFAYRIRFNPIPRPFRDVLLALPPLVESAGLRFEGGFYGRRKTATSYEMTRYKKADHAGPPDPAPLMDLDSVTFPTLHDATDVLIGVIRHPDFTELYAIIESTDPIQQDNGGWLIQLIGAILEGFGLDCGIVDSADVLALENSLSTDAVLKALMAAGPPERPLAALLRLGVLSESNLQKLTPSRVQRTTTGFFLVNFL